MMKIITQFSRVFVGVLFIISGLIKLNDPVGFSFKLEEYFGETVLNLPFLAPYALGIALFVVIFEVVLGVALLVGSNKKLTMWSLLLMIVFFTFLTFYSAYFNKVTDCGCFGDALKLTPWESFTKDIVLLFFILILFFNQKYINPIGSKLFRTIVVLTTVIACGFMGWYVLNYLPIKDFRAYAVGVNIQEGMAIPEGAPVSEVEMTFIYNVNGQNQEFTEATLANIPEGATFVDRIDKVITPGYVPPIHDFTMELDGSDYTEELLEEPKLLMFVAYDLERSNAAGLAKLNKLYADAKSKGYKVIGMTASPATISDAVKQKYNLEFDFYFCDAVTLKTIERANPSLVLLEKGTIVQKLHWNEAHNLMLR